MYTERVCVCVWVCVWPSVRSWIALQSRIIKAPLGSRDWHTYCTWGIFSLPASQSGCIQTNHVSSHSRTRLTYHNTWSNRDSNGGTKAPCCYVAPAPHLSQPAAAAAAVWECVKLMQQAFGLIRPHCPIITLCVCVCVCMCVCVQHLFVCAVSVFFLFKLFNFCLFIIWLSVFLR